MAGAPQKLKIFDNHSKRINGFPDSCRYLDGNTGWCQRYTLFLVFLAIKRIDYFLEKICRILLIRFRKACLKLFLFEIALLNRCLVSLKRVSTKNIVTITMKMIIDCNLTLRNNRILNRSVFAFSATVS